MRTVTLMKEARFAKKGENLVSVALPHTVGTYLTMDHGSMNIMH